MQQSQLKKQVKALQNQISRYELAEQRNRDIQSRLDMQIDIFTRIHKCSQSAFAAKDTNELNTIIAEGVVDIFQFELGAVFLLSVEKNCLEIQGQCNVDWPECTIPLNSRWLARKEFWTFNTGKVFWETYSQTRYPLASLGLAWGMYAPLYNSSQEFEGLIFGGVREASQAFYDFHPAEIQSSFMVFVRHMNGIINNTNMIKKANEAEQSKTHFLANLSHEMRTPLNAIIGMAQICSQKKSLETYKKSIQQIQISSQHLMKLINNVLDLSKIGANKLQLAIDEFDLKELVNTVLINTTPNSRKKHQNIDISFGNVQNFSFWGDKLRLSQVVLNLLSNAVKFTPEYGSISLSIQERSRDEKKVLLHFSVKDSGIGITPECQKKIFSPFEQARTHEDEQLGGTGLGLAISQRIVGLMGGEIQVESSPGQGARFYFDAWFVPNLKEKTESPDHIEETPHDINFSGKTILIVDDIEINRFIILSMLENSNAKLEVASHGHNALDMVLQSPEGYYDAILMDVQMPVMDGYTAVQEIRKLNRNDTKNIPVLAMTANVFKEDIQKALVAGMNDHIGKPVEYQVLVKKLQKFLL